MGRLGFAAAALAFAALASPAAAGSLLPKAHEPVPRSDQLPSRDPPERVLSQLMWDASERALVRRRVEVLDLFAGRDLDLMWEPSSGEAESGPASGEGRLVWRRAGAPPYDASAIVAEFEGTLRDGRPHGSGRYRHASGATYRGGWTDGRMDGTGRLRWADGEEYVGGFRDGLFDGEGRLTLRDGSVFAGHFREGRRHGRGHVMPAEERSYVSAWTEGEEVPGARRMLQGPSGLEHLRRVQQSGYDDVRLGVGVNRSHPEGYGPGDIIMYDAANEDGALAVFPEDRDFVGAWRGTLPLPFSQWGVPLYQFTQDYHEPASLSFDVENTGISPLYLVGGYLSVAESVPDLDPAILVLRQIDCRQPTITSFIFENYGWSQPDAPFIDGGVLTRGGGQVVQPLSGDVAEGWPRAEVDLRDALQGLGVRFDYLEENVVPCDLADPGACLADVRQSGVLGSVAEAAYVDGDALMIDFGGSLDYTWHDAAGRAHAKSSDFVVAIKVGNLPGEIQTCAEGGAGIEVYPDPFMLQQQGRDYFVPFSMDAAVAPGEVSRWSFQVDAPMASLHEFQVVLQLADGRELISRPIRLTYWRPASPWES